MGSPGVGGSISAASDVALNNPIQDDLMLRDGGYWKNVPAGTKIAGLVTAAGAAQTALDTRYVRTVNGVTPDGSGNVAVDIGPAGASSGVIMLDSYSGTDDQKLTAAIADQQATSGKPAIIMSARSHTFNQTRNLYSGLKLIGTPAGPRNMEIASGAHVPTRVYLGAAINSGTGSWWVPPVAGGDVFDVYMADFGVGGNQGSSVHQFIDYPVATGSMYACQFHALSFNFMRGVFGRKDRKCALTQVVFSGHWTANNLWDTQFHLGGSDCQLWVGGFINMGPSQSPVQTGSYADNDYQVLIDTMGKTDIGYMYISAMNGWRGLKVTGNSHGLRFFGGTYEGYKGTTDLFGGRAPGTLIRLQGGSGAFFGPSIGQGMNDPDPAEGGLVHMTGGEWTFYSPTFFRATMDETVPCIYHAGGRLHVTGVGRYNGEVWTDRPRYYTTATGVNTGSYSFYCPDMSMVAV